MRKTLILIAALVPGVSIAPALGYCPIYPVKQVIQPTKITALQKEEKCLAVMVYGEARGEAKKGQVAVAYTVLNRLNKSPKKTVCQVVLAPKQYSIFNNNPTLRQAATSLHVMPPVKNEIDHDSWKQAQLVAKKVLNGKIEDPTGGATHYVADRVMKSKGYRYPRWTRVFRQVAEIDNHRFFVEGEKI